MAAFTVRVELHGATERDYETLHKKMWVEGFSRTITADNGKTYHLPTAEYDMQAALTRAEVRVKAKRAADQTGKKNSVLVSEATGRTWEGLEEVKQPATSR